MSPIIVVLVQQLYGLNLEPAMRLSHAKTTLPSKQDRTMEAIFLLYYRHWKVAALILKQTDL